MSAGAAAAAAAAAYTASSMKQECIKNISSYPNCQDILTQDFFSLSSPFTLTIIFFAIIFFAIGVTALGYGLYLKQKANKNET